MLEEKDLQAIKSIVESTADKRITESENLILKYVDDTRKVLEKQIAQVRENMEELEKKTA